MRMRMAVCALLVSVGAAGSALARDGGSDLGDAYLNDAQRNPRFIEPGGDFAPGRYRVSNPYYGYGDRQRAAAQGYYGPRGRVEVQPYDAYRP